MRLNELKPGDVATIEKIAGDRNQRRRFMDMGLVKGTEIEVLRCAPFGDPIEFLFRSYNLALRKNEAECIFVEVADAGK